MEVYGLNLDAHGPIEGFEGFLSPAERAEVARIRQGKERRRLAKSRGALRWIVARYLERAAAEVPLSRDSRGKPFIETGAFGGRDPLHVSCSRSGPYAVYAVAAGHLVGVDLEAANADRFPEHVAEIVLSPAERDTYAGLSGNARAIWLARTWVAKEAILKGLGCGLEIHPAALTVGAACRGAAAADAQVPAADGSWTSRPTVVSPWWLCESEWGACVVALAVPCRPARVRFVDLTSNDPTVTDVPPERAHVSLTQ